MASENHFLFSLRGVNGKQSIRESHLVPARSVTVENASKVALRWPIRPCVSQQRYKTELHGGPSAWALGQLGRPLTSGEGSLTLGPHRPAGPCPEQTPDSLISHLLGSPVY